MKSRFTILELATVLGTPEHILRRWVNDYELAPSGRNEAGDQEYLPEEALIAWLVFSLERENFRQEKIRDAIRRLHEFLSGLPEGQPMPIKEIAVSKGGSQHRVDGFRVDRGEIQFHTSTMERQYVKIRLSDLYIRVQQHFPEPSSPMRLVSPDAEAV